jgi:dynein heavy chain 2, cytosolic
MVAQTTCWSYICSYADTPAVLLPLLQELEAQKSALLQTEESFKVQLAVLEKSLLQTLATSKGNILDNQELLDSLNETKIKSTTIEKSLHESHALQVR